MIGPTKLATLNVPRQTNFETLLLIFLFDTQSILVEQMGLESKLRIDLESA